MQFGSNFKIANGVILIHYLKAGEWLRLGFLGNGTELIVVEAAYTPQYPIITSV
jgi:hypothetical protein